MRLGEFPGAENGVIGMRRKGGRAAIAFRTHRDSRPARAERRPHSPTRRPRSPRRRNRFHLERALPFSAVRVSLSLAAQHFPPGSPFNVIRVQYWSRSLRRVRCTRNRCPFRSIDPWLPLLLFDGRTSSEVAAHVVAHLKSRFCPHKITRRLRLVFLHRFSVHCQWRPLV